MAPVIIIESKSVGADLDRSFAQLRGSVKANPPMKRVGNLNRWVEMADVQRWGEGKLDRKLFKEIDIKNGNSRETAKTLHECLNRN